MHMEKVRTPNKTGTSQRNPAAEDSDSSGAAGERFFNLAAVIVRKSVHGWYEEKMTYRLSEKTREQERVASGIVNLNEDQKVMTLRRLNEERIAAVDKIKNVSLSAEVNEEREFPGLSHIY